MIPIFPELTRGGVGGGLVSLRELDFPSAPAFH